MPKNRGSSQLSAQETRDAVRRSAPRAAVVFEAIRLEAVEELERENTALFWSGIAAGLSMVFSFIAETARVAVIVIITCLVGLGGFSHIIAGSTLAFYALAAGLTTPWTVLSGFFLPTLIGSIIGGVAFVALLNYAQVAHND